MKRKPARRKKQVFFVIGHDLRSDGHTRLTKGDNYVVQGGTESSHSETVDIVQAFSGRLRKDRVTDPRDAHEILKDVMKKKGFVPAPRPDAKKN
jgi:hypothetical protein